MKKTTLAIGIVAVLGIGYVGTAWYTGNIIESNIDSQLKQLVEKINSIEPDYNTSITYHDYQKNLFSTKLHLTVTQSPKNTSDTAEEQPKKLFDDELTIHHGPFPIAALSSGTFIPQMAWIEYKMTEQASPELWKLAGNQPFITGHIGLSYSNYIKVKLVNKAISLNEENFDVINGNLDISKGYYTFESDQDFSNMLISSHLDKLNYNKQEFDDDINTISINNVEISIKPNVDTKIWDYEFDMDNISIHIESTSEGNVSLDNFKSKGTFNPKNEDFELQSNIDKWTIAPANIDNSIELNNIIFNQTKKLNEQDSVDSSLKANIEAMKYGQQNLGSITVDIDTQNIDKSFYSNTRFNKFNINNINSSKFANAKFSLNKFNWHNADGDINLSFSFKLTENAKKAFDLSQLDSLKLSLDAPFNVLARIQTQLANPETSNVTAEEIDEAQTSLEMLTGMFLQKVKTLTFSKGDIKGIYSDIDYARERGDEIKINGKTYSKEEVLSQF